MEHDPVEIVESVERCIEEATKSFTKKGYLVSDIRAIGITTQRETTVLWDSKTGEAIHNAIAWPDTRTQGLVRELKQKKGADKLQDICGLPLSTYPSSMKLTWMFRNLVKVRELYDAGRLAFGTIDTWLLYNLNGKEKFVHVTDVTNASRTMFVNLHTLEYDQTVLDFFDIDPEKMKLPKIVPSSDLEAFGSLGSGPLQGVKITGCLGDQSAALVGQLGFSPGQAKNTYGTGCFLLYNVGEKPVMSTHGLLATVAYHFGGKRKPVYALEGSIAVAGSAVKFLQHNFGFIEASHHISDLAGTVEDNGGCVFVTAFSGLFAPYWIDDAKGTIFGITQHTQRGHIARATLEATCFQTKAILEAMEKDSGHKLEKLAVDGGMSNSDLCMQVCVLFAFFNKSIPRALPYSQRCTAATLIVPVLDTVSQSMPRANPTPSQTQADITNIPVDRPVMRETTSLGAAIAAGFAVDVWKEFEELKEINKGDRTVFQPKISKDASDKMYSQWEKAVEMSRGWVDSNEEEPRS